MLKLKPSSMLLETAVSCVLLAVLAFVCLKSFAAAAEQRLAMDQRQIMIREAANLMEKTAAIPWDDLNRERVQTIAESAEKLLQKEIPGAKVVVEIVLEKDDPAVKRIALSLEWQNMENFERYCPVRLTAWRYRS
jgi:hypothetical protein